MKEDIDGYLATKNEKLLENIRVKLYLCKKDIVVGGSSVNYNVPLLNAVVLYVGIHLPSEQGQADPAHAGQAESATVIKFVFGFGPESFSRGPMAVKTNKLKRR